VLQAFFPKISITEPDLSSLAGTNPPNPVLAVRSGNLELEPFIFSLEGDFFNKLLVTSGIELRLLNLKLVFKFEVELTNPPPTLKFGLGQALSPSLRGPLVTTTGSLFFTNLGGLNVKLFAASDTDSAGSITVVGAEKLYLGVGGLIGVLILFKGRLTSTGLVEIDPLLALVGGWRLGLFVSVELDFCPQVKLARCFLGESHFSFSSNSLF